MPLERHKRASGKAWIDLTESVDSAEEKGIDRSGPGWKKKLGTALILFHTHLFSPLLAMAHKALSILSTHTVSADKSGRVLADALQRGPSLLRRIVFTSIASDAPAPAS